MLQQIVCQCLTSFLHEALLCSQAHLSQTKSPFPSSITRVSSGSISLPHISHFIKWVFVISFILASLCYKHHFCWCRYPSLVLRLMFSKAANSAAISSFQKISSSLELEISLIFLFLCAARSAASDSVFYYPRFCSLVFIVNAYD